MDRFGGAFGSTSPVPRRSSQAARVSYGARDFFASAREKFSSFERVGACENLLLEGTVLDLIVDSNFFGDWLVL